MTTLGAREAHAARIRRPLEERVGGLEREVTRLRAQVVALGGDPDEVDLRDEEVVRHG